MIDREEVLKILEDDLRDAGIEPEKHLSDTPPGSYIGKRCKECEHFYKTEDRKGKPRRWFGCRPRRLTTSLTGGEFACKEFKPI